MFLLKNFSQLDALHKTPFHAASNYLKTSQFYPITFICFASFMLCFVSPKLSIVTGLVLAFWLFMRAKPDGLLGIFLLYLSRYYFYESGNSVEHNLRDTFSIADFPCEVETIACLYIVLRVFFEKNFWPENYRSTSHRIIFVLWIVAFLPVLIGTYPGYQMRIYNWSGGLRFMMIAGSYFYGYILAKHWPNGRNDLLILILLPFVFVMLLLMNLGIFWSHQCFFLIALSGAFSIYLIRKRSFPYRLLGIIFLFLSIRFGITHPVTTLAISFLSIFLAYFETMKSSKLFHPIKKIIITMLVFSGIFFTVYIVYKGFCPDYVSEGIYIGEVESLGELAKAKAFSDRLPIWIEATKQIFAGPYFIVPTRPIMNIPGYENGWWNGSHNVILESLRVNGLFAGTIMLIIFFLALKNMVLVLTSSKSLILRSLAAAILGTAIVGMTTGNFPIDMTVGFWIWGLAGLCHGLFLKEMMNYSEHEKIYNSQQAQLFR